HLAHLRQYEHAEDHGAGRHRVHVRPGRHERAGDDRVGEPAAERERLEPHRRDRNAERSRRQLRRPANGVQPRQRGLAAVLDARTYDVTDRAGNTLTLVLHAHTIAHALNANVVSVRYGNAASLVPPVNRLEFDWSSGKKLEQSVVVEKGKPRAAVDATYDQAK